jgi:hypothetical protein
MSAMFDLLDLLLLRRGIPTDDQTLAFRCIEGDPRSRVIYFLPWHTPLRLARHFGFVPLPFLAAYELPPAIVSSEPERCILAAKGMVEHAERLLARHGVKPVDALIVGLSAGTFPATLLANRLRARLCSVAGADRADLMVWESPAARIVRRRAVSKGYSRESYTDVMRGYNAAENLDNIATDSMFVMGTRDPFVPMTRSAAWARAIQKAQPSAQIVRLEAGHVRTLATKTAQRVFGKVKEASSERSGKRPWHHWIGVACRPPVVPALSGIICPPSQEKAGSAPDRVPVGTACMSTPGQSVSVA